MNSMPASSHPAMRERLRHWFDHPAGRSLLQAELGWLGQWLPGLFGYHIMQLGQPGGIDLLQASRIGHHIHTAVASSAAAGTQAGLYCREDHLPLAADSVDVLVLPHVLEFENSPHQVLRECQRVLIGNGYILIVTFNPWSLWGLWRLCLGWRSDPPWSGRYYSATRLQDWLRLLDFEVLEVRKMYYRPPLQHVTMQNRLAFMEHLGHWCWPWWGGVHAIVAQKRVLPLTPLTEPWRRRRPIASGLAEPTARETCSRNPAGTPGHT